MLRVILGVVAGYVAMAVLVIASLALALMLLGPDGAFAPGTYKPSPAWVAISLVGGVVGSVMGGWLFALISRRPGAVWALLAVIVLMGGLAAAMEIRKADPGPRTGPVTLEAMAKSKTPGWLLVVNPLTGVIGAWVGSRLRPVRSPAA